MAVVVGVGVVVVVVVVVVLRRGPVGGGRLLGLGGRAGVASTISFMLFVTGGDLLVLITVAGLCFLGVATGGLEQVLSSLIEDSLPDRERGRFGGSGALFIASCWKLQLR